MMIEFQCGNITTTNNKRVVCGNGIIVSDELIGELVTCAKCRQTVEVPVVTRAAREPNINRRTPAPQRRRSSQSASKATTSKSRTTDRGIDEYQSTEPLDLASTDLAKYGEEPASSGYLDSPPRIPRSIDRLHCERCGAIMDKSGRCSSCGSKEKKSSHAKPSLDDVQMELAGFQLWFVSTIGEAIPFFFLEWALHFSVLFIVIGLSIASFAFQGFFPGILLVILIMSFAGMYAWMAVNGHRLASSPNARLVWFQKPFWYGLLVLARMLKWQGYDSNLKGRTIIDLRNQTVTDHQLPKIENISRCEVLDLEGTQISDEGLKHLLGIKTLKCLVVRKTDVTREGVVRLQQSRRRLWIWH